MAMSLFARDSEKFFRRMGSLLTILFPLAGVIGVLITLVTGMTNLLILSVFLVVPLLVISLLYRYLSKHDEAYSDQDERSFKLQMIAFMLFFSISVVLLTLTEVRSIAYYLAVVAMAVTILVEILRFKPEKGRVTLIILQIMALMLNLNWGVTLKYFMFIGRTDVMYHNMYVSSILEFSISLRRLNNKILCSPYSLWLAIHRALTRLPEA
jgi:hypothetical protein